jgi:hypothetical protein
MLLFCYICHRSVGGMKYPPLTFAAILKKEVLWFPLNSDKKSTMPSSVF